MKIWIDLANSPHVLFFEPIAAELERRGHEVVFTARDFAQTVGLAKQKGMAFTVIGRNDHSALGAKGRQLIGRAFGLARFAGGHPIDLALSHNSYSQILASRLLRIPSVTLMDYEHQPANHLAFRLANKVIVPSVLPQEALSKLGAKPRKTRRYNGLKEEVYLADFKPSPGFLDALGVPDNMVLATVRPPAFSAVYHRFDNPLFSETLDLLRRQENVYTIIAPRGDGRALSDKYAGPNMSVLDRPVDGKNLIYYSDLVISGGGTMNREAAALGTPAYTIYAGRLGSVDASLVKRRRLVFIGKRDDLSEIRLQKKSIGGDRAVKINLLNEIVDEILDLRSHGRA